MITDSNLEWGTDFPPVYGHTSISFVKRCPGYSAAKNGDMQAALKVAGICVKNNQINEIKQRYPMAELLPVITENKLPEALARMIGLKVHTGVSVSGCRRRKGLKAMERLLDKPSFIGAIKKGQSYIIVDDIVTQGGTVSELRKFVTSNGGTVVAVASLAYSAGSKNIASDTDDINRLAEKFSLSVINDILKDYRIANDPCELTKPQVRYLLRFKEAERIKSKIDTCIRG